MARTRTDRDRGRLSVIPMSSDVLAVIANMPVIAERALPAELYERVRRVYRASEGTRPPALLSADRQRPGAGAAPKG